MRFWLYTFILLITNQLANAQIGGSSTYSFLNLPNSARVTALGGYLPAVVDEDVNATYQNPALLNPSMHNRLSLSYIDWFSDVKYGYAAYARSYQGIGNFALGLQYINYGTFNAADESGTINGTFTGGDYVLQLGYSRPLSKDSMFTAGANLKGIVSNYETYNSFGAALDIGVTYNNPAKRFTASAVVRNLGVQFKPYASTREPLPLDVQLGLSTKLKYLPLRFMLTAHSLQRFMGLGYIDTLSRPTTDPLTGESTIPTLGFGNRLMRHFVFGIEFSPLKFFSFRAGYNYQRRQEFAIETRRGTVGLSWGLSLKISKFRIDYSRSAFHLAGSPNHITLQTNLSDWVKR